MLIQKSNQHFLFKQILTAKCNDLKISGYRKITRRIVMKVIFVNHAKIFTLISYLIYKFEPC